MRKYISYALDLYFRVVFSVWVYNPNPPKYFSKALDLYFRGFHVINNNLASPEVFF
jgi:hypothetical protein